jgi:hypothetical protein
LGIRGDGVKVKAHPFAPTGGNQQEKATTFGGTDAWKIDSINPCDVVPANFFASLHGPLGPDPGDHRELVVREDVCFCSRNADQHPVDARLCQACGPDILVERFKHRVKLKALIERVVTADFALEGMVSWLGV